MINKDDATKLVAVTPDQLHALATLYQTALRGYIDVWIVPFATVHDKVHNDTLTVQEAAEFICFLNSLTIQLLETVEKQSMAIIGAN